MKTTAKCAVPMDEHINELKSNIDSRDFLIK